MATKKKSTNPNWRTSRPQNKNLIPFNELPKDQLRSIQSAGGKASAKAARERKAMAELMKIFCDLPIADKRRSARLKRLGIEENDLTNKMSIAVAIGESAQSGNVYAADKVLQLLGEHQVTAADKVNNLLEALSDIVIKDEKNGENFDDIHEIQPEAESDADVVDAGEVQKP